MKASSGANRTSVAKTATVTVPSKRPATEDVAEQSSSDSEADEGAENEDPEAEFHTDEDDEDASEDGEDDGLAVNAAPLLPPHLLQPLPSPAYSGPHGLAIPRDQLTPKQKKTQRHRSRQAKKRIYDRIRQGVKGSGVLEAGRVAQLKRGVEPRTSRVQSGRVEKRPKLAMSGRQQLLEQRKRLAGSEAGHEVRKVKKAKK